MPGTSVPYPSLHLLRECVRKSDPERARRIVLVQPSAGRAHWYLGGRPPEAALVSSAVRRMQYLATVPLNPDNHDSSVLSIFLAPYPELRQASRRWRSAGAVEVVIHEPSSRVETWNNPQEPSNELAIAISEASDDKFVREDGAEMGDEGLKLFGRPAFISHNEAQAAWEDLERGGFRQFIQFDFPSLSDSVRCKGNWPFGDGLFSLIVNSRDDTENWRWCWQVA